MRKAFVTVLGAAAIGFLAVATGAGPIDAGSARDGHDKSSAFFEGAAQPNRKAREVKAQARWAHGSDEEDRDPRYQQMGGPCQVEG
jgi:hypothetical protein